MNLKQIDWWKWVIYFLLVAALISLIACNGCALLQPAGGWFKPKPTLTPTNPSGQLWQTVKKSNWITTLAIPIIALGAVAAFNGMVKLGMSAAIFGCVNLFMALATARFAMWMAVFGLIGSVVTVAVSILVKNKALKEIIFGTQKLKEEVIADMHIPRAKEILTKQSKPTQKLVQNVKSKLKLKGKI